MKKYLRTILIGMLILVVGFSLFVCIAFFGTPWDRFMAAQKLTPYLEEKYDLEFEMIGTTFNFKDGAYGARYKTEDGMEIRAEISGSNKDVIFDYYPEAVWRKQLRDEMEGPTADIFPTAESIVMDGVYGVSQRLSISKEIPSFKDIHSHFYIHIKLQETWDEKRQEEKVEQLWKLLQILQEKKIHNVKVNLFFQIREDSKVTHGFSIPSDEVFKVHKKEDVLKYKVKFGETS